MDITEKIWWMAVDGESFGPYSYLDIEKDDRLRPDSYVWKEGWEKWQKAKEVDELKDIFRKDVPEEIEIHPIPPSDEEITTTTTTSAIPPWIFFWIVAIILSIAYLWHLFRT